MNQKSREEKDKKEIELFFLSLKKIYNFSFVNLIQGKFDPV